MKCCGKVTIYGCIRECWEDRRRDATSANIMESRWMEMERVSVITHSLCVGLPSRFVARCEASERRLIEASKSRNYVVIRPVSVLNRKFVCDESKSVQISEEVKHAEARARSKRCATSLSNFTEYKNRQGCGIRLTQICKIQTVLYLPFCCRQTKLGVYDNGAAYPLSREYLSFSVSKRALGVDGIEFKKHTAARFFNFGNRNALSENGFENASDFGFNRRDNENLLHIRSKFCETNIKRGKVLPVLLGSTVLFLFLSVSFPKTALAQQSHTVPATPTSEESQHPATTPEVSSLDKQNISSQTIEGKTANGSADSTDNDTTEGLKPQPNEISIEEYVESHPTDINAHRSLLQFYMQNGEVKGALRLLDKLSVLQPDNLEWKYLTAQAYDFSGDAKAALKAFEELSRLRPLSARILQGLAVSMQKTGENPIAIVEMLQHAVNKAVIEKKTKEARNLCMLLGQTLTLQGKLGDALTQYKQLEKEDSKDFRPFLCQGLVYSILGKTEEAENSFRHYRKLCPSNFPNRGYLDELMLKAKIEARRFQERQQKEREAGSMGLRGTKSMKQPKTNLQEKSDKQ